MTSILVGAVALFVFGAVWFTVLFGRIWAKLMGFDPAGDEKSKEMGMVKPMIANFLANVIIASSIYYIFPRLFTLSFGDLLKVVLIIWLGFAFPIYANAAIWERKSWKLVVLNSAYGIISYSIITAVIYYIQ